jgi:hypothetical protein
MFRCDTDNNYHYTITKVSEYIEAFGLIEVIKDIIHACNDPVACGYLRTMSDRLERQRQEDEHYLRLAAYYEEQHESY